MTRIITVTSQKGGVAKTTTSVTIATGLARAGHAVLLADFDPQGHAAIALGLDPSPGVFNYLVGGIDQATVNTEHNVSLLPGNSRTKTAEAVLRTESSPAEIAARLEQLFGVFDYVVIDTPASGLLQEVAIRMARVLVVPVRCEALGLDGVAATMQIAKQVAPAARVFILPTMYYKQYTEHQANRELLRRNYPNNVVMAVPGRIAVAQAVADQCTIWEYKDPAMDDVRAGYENLLRCIVEVV